MRAARKSGEIKAQSVSGAELPLHLEQTLTHHLLHHHHHHNQYHGDQSDNIIVITIITTTS